MKKILLILPLLMFMVTASAQSPTLGVSIGESFTFNITHFFFSQSEGLGLDQASTITTTDVVSGVTTIDETTDDGPYEETAIEFCDDTDISCITLEEGDSFTITVLDDTLIKGEYGDYGVKIEYTDGINTIQTIECAEFGCPIIPPTWDEYRNTIESDRSQYSDDDEFGSGTYSIIDTADEFGVKSTTDYSFSDANYERTGSGVQEQVYEKSTGVLNYINFEEKSTYSYDGQTYSFQAHIQLVRDGYTIGNDDPGLALPGFEFYLIAPAILLIPILRRKLTK